MDILQRIHQFKQETFDFKKSEVAVLIEKISYTNNSIKNLITLYQQLVYPDEEIIELIYELLLRLEEGIHSIDSIKHRLLFEKTQTKIKALLQQEKQQKVQDEQEADLLLASL